MRTKLFSAALLVVAPAALAVLLSPSAHADPNSDFLGCLANHQVSYDNENAMLDLGSKIQNDFRNGLSSAVIEHNVVYNFDTKPSIAHIDVQCVAATMLMGSSR